MWKKYCITEQSADKYGACALHVGYLRPQTRTHNVQYILFFHCNNGCTNTPQRYVLRYIKKNPTKCNNILKFYYSIFIWSLTCFGWHTAHHHEPKPALAASGFSNVEGYWTCSWWTLSGTVWEQNGLSSFLTHLLSQ
jgi:hypothetical protein